MNSIALPIRETVSSELTCLQFNKLSQTEAEILCQRDDTCNVRSEMTCSRYIQILRIEIGEFYDEVSYGA